MQFFNQFLKSSPKEKQLSKSGSLHLFFDDMLNHFDSPFALALEDLKKLESTCSTKNEFLDYLLEDAVFISLHLTFYEKLFLVLGEHPHLALNLMDKFSCDIKEREFIISKEAFCHVEYIENHGTCDGCEAHENHQDVDSLIEYFESKDMDFFIQLYLGMQAIQYTFDKLLYDILPDNPSLFVGQDEKSILELRKYIFDYVSNELKSA